MLRTWKEEARPAECAHSTRRLALRAPYDFGGVNHLFTVSTMVAMAVWMALAAFGLPVGADHAL